MNESRCKGLTPFPVQSWISPTSTTGAGIDSFFEYLAKAYILLGDDEYYRIWSEAYEAVMKNLRSNDGFWVRLHCLLYLSAMVDVISSIEMRIWTLAPLSPST